MEKKPDFNQAKMLRCRGMNPKDYVVVKVLYSAVWFKNIHTGYIKIINKSN